jgi:signal transduction histidine kinase
LFDCQSKELVLNSFYNSVNLNLAGIRRRIGEGVSGKVMDIKEPILVKNIDEDSRFRHNGFNHYKTKSFISIPLFTAGGVLGLINLADKSSGEPFSEKDLEFAVNLSRYSCIIVDHLLHSSKLQQEKETLDKQKLLLEKYASVGKLAAGIVHEINNPLDGVIRYTNILLDQIENNSVRREYLLEAKKGLNRIANITRSLLEFSHQVNSDSLLPKKYTDLHCLIDDSLSVLASKINGNIQIYKRYKENLSKVLDFGLSHIVINIINNAFDAMPDGGILEISTDVKDSRVEISFKDTGTGMPPEVEKRIFEPFFTTKNVDKGTGLGLAICNEIIDKYEGRIEIKSAPEVGSTFTVIIPKKYLENA